MHTMIFRAPGSHRIHGHDVEYRVVPDSLVPQHLAEGWSTTAIEAGAKHAAELVDKAQADRDAQERAIAEEMATKPPTREELEQKAGELGLTFGPRISDKKLRDMVDAAIEQA